MAIFCTKCGTKNENDAAFCDYCGEKLRAIHLTAPVADQQTDQTTTPPAHEAKGSATAGRVNPTVTPKKAIYAGAALVAVVVLGGGAMYFLLQPPAATASTLLAAAKAGYGKTTTDAFKRELCLANTDYSKSTFNADQNDATTQAWMNALVAAGLYSPPVTIESSGLFSRILLQYVATPELEKYREGSRLCLAKDVEIADVIDIGKPEEQSLGRNDGPPKVLTVKTKLLFRSSNTAPWMGKQAVRDVVMANMPGWEYKDTNLEKQVTDSFGLREKKWATGPVYKADLEKMYSAAQRGQKIGEIERPLSNAKNDGAFSGISSALSGMFSFGGHPLKGTWRMDTEGMGKSLGMNLPSGLGLDSMITFTSNSLDVGGQSVKCKFEVDGDRIKVIPEGQATSLIFLMRDRNTATLDMGLVEMRYKRVK